MPRLLAHTIFNSNELSRSVKYLKCTRKQRGVTSMLLPIQPKAEIIRKLKRIALGRRHLMNRPLLG